MTGILAGRTRFFDILTFLSNDVGGVKCMILCKSGNENCKNTYKQGMKKCKNYS